MQAFKPNVLIQGEARGRTAQNIPNGL